MSDTFFDRASNSHWHGTVDLMGDYVIERAMPNGPREHVCTIERDQLHQIRGCSFVGMVGLLNSGIRFGAAAGRAALKSDIRRVLGAG